MMQIHSLMILTVLLVALASCARSSARRTENDILGDAHVESINVHVRESFPPRVTVIAQGTLRDVCTKIDEATVQRTDHTFRVQITTRRPADEICAQVLAPFEKTVELDTADLPPGTYTVEVNGVTDTFTL